MGRRIYFAKYVKDSSNPGVETFSSRVEAECIEEAVVLAVRAAPGGYRLVCVEGSGEHAEWCNWLQGFCLIPPVLNTSDAKVERCCETSRLCCFYCADPCAPLLELMERTRALNNQLRSYVLTIQR